VNTLISTTGSLPEVEESRSRTTPIVLPRFSRRRKCQLEMVPPVMRHWLTATTPSRFSLGTQEVWTHVMAIIDVATSFVVGVIAFGTACQCAHSSLGIRRLDSTESLRNPLLWKRLCRPQSMMMKQQSPTTSLALLVGHSRDSMHSNSAQGNQRETPGNWKSSSMLHTLKKLCTRDDCLCINYHNHRPQ